VNKGGAIAAGTLALLVLVGGSAAVSAFHKDVTLSVDGQPIQAQAFGMTVADVLEANHIMVGNGDVVAPPVNSIATDGQTITVKYLKHVNLKIDGQALALTTTATTLGDAIDAVAGLPDIEGAAISVPVATPLPRTGLDVVITTPKDVRLIVGGGKAQAVSTASSTIAEMLNELSIQVGPNDRLMPRADKPVTDGMTVTLDRVSVATKDATEPIPFQTVNKTNAALWKGEVRTATTGVEGKAKRTYQLTKVNGKLASRLMVSETVLVKPVDKVVETGTKTSPNGVGINLARASQWDKIARCESGGNWHINTGNGYYGGLQFNLQTWRSVHGGDFAARPDQATREQQITVANRLYAKRGFQPWTCRRVL